jgi:hypothetical protein
MLPAEFLCLALYFLLLDSLVRKQRTDANYVKTLRIWVIIELVLFAALTILAFVMTSGFTIIAGALYLFSLGLAIGVTIRLRKTVEFAAS